MTVNLAQTISGLLKTYGETLFLDKEKTSSFQGMLQPMLLKDHGGDSLGYGSTRAFRGYFPAITLVENLGQGDCLYCGSGEFRIATIEGYRLEGASVYFKAVVYRTEGLG